MTRPRSRWERSRLEMREARRLGHLDARSGYHVLGGEVRSLVPDSRPDGEWVCGKLAIQGRDIGFVAHDVAGLQVGRLVTVTGGWERHDRYGVQFVVTGCRRSELPREAAALARYLEANVGGVGGKIARKLIDRLGTTDLLERLQQNPGIAAKVLSPKVGTTVVFGLRRWASDVRAERWSVDIAPKLMAAAGITYATARQIVRYFDAPEVADLIARRDPYRLLEVPGFGWNRADSIAQRLGVAATAEARLEAAVLYTLREAMSREGHAGLPPDRLVSRTTELVACDHALVEDALVRLERYCFVMRDEGLIFEPDALGHEWAIAGLVDTLVQRRYALGEREVAVKRAIAAIRPRLNAAQADAVRMAVTHGISVLTGGPGTGKTHALKGVVAAATALGLEVIIAAPTGKAASVVRNKTKHSNCGTVHRLIGGVPGNARKDGPITRGLLVLEESSMLDAEVTAWLAMNVRPGPDFRLVFVGDVDQLPSVGPGRVLADLLGCGVVAATTLVDVQRQAVDSRIVQQAYRVLQGRDLLRYETHDWTHVDLPSDPDAAQEVVLRTVKRVISQEQASARRRGEPFDPYRDLQVLTPYRGEVLGSDALNARLRALLNSNAVTEGPWIAGGHRVAPRDRVTCVRNDYTVKPDGLMNGEQGVVKEAGDGAVTVLLDDGRRVVTRGVQNQSLALAFAATVHRSQGSEYPVVVLVYHRTHFSLLDQRLLYTAITRARMRLVLCADETALRVSRERGTELGRSSGLASRIIHAQALRTAGAA